MKVLNSFSASSDMISDMIPVIIIGIIILFLVACFIFFVANYKKCPADKIMVIFGSYLGKNPDGTSKIFKCMHGGAVLVLPIIQRHFFLDLTPITVSIEIIERTKDRKKVKGNIRITFGISTLPDMMQRAAERLLGLTVTEIEILGEDIASGQIKSTLYQTDSQDLDDRSAFLERASINIEEGFKQLGLRLINFQISDFEEVKKNI